MVNNIMNTIVQLSIILLSYLWGALVIDAHCLPQCVCAETFMVCTFDDRDPPELQVDLNQIFELENYMLPPDLTEIYFTGSPILFIADSAFDNSAKTLRILSFSRCIITKIPDALLNLTALQIFSITDTNIEDWNEAAMKNIAPTIQTMTLSNVGLTSWPSWLAQFPHVVELTAQNSNISSIPDDAFDLMYTNITSLSLSNNKLTSVPKALWKLSRLEILELSQNMICDVTWLPQSNVLTDLILDSNSLSDSLQLSNALQNVSTSLSVLDLHNNKLTSIPNLLSRSTVGRLDLSNNRLSDDVSGNLPNGLLELDLEYNLLPYIPTVISTLTSMTVLNVPFNLIAEIRGSDFSQAITMVTLDNNLLTELDEGSFPINSNIDTLSLNDNPITAITPTAFQNTPRLNILNLRNTHLTRVPLALNSLQSLGSIDLTGSKNLVCTCAEKSLQHSIISMSAQVVLGDCGLTSIYIFFTTLSPYCPE